MSRLTKWLEPTILLLALVLLGAATLPWISTLGLEYDEAHFLPSALKIANGAEEKLPLPWGITVAHRPIPIMTMPYVGALDAFVYAAPYRLLGASVIVSRITNLLLGIAIFGLAYLLARRNSGLWGGAITLALLLADVELVLHTPTNFGPFLLQQLLTVGALICLDSWWRGGKGWYFFLAVAQLALAFHEKLTFLWILSSLAIAVIAFRGKSSWQRSRWWYTPLALLLALVILSPILYFAFSAPEVMLGFGKQNTKLPVHWLSVIGDRWRVFDLMLRGTWTMEFTAGPVPATLHRSIALHVLFFGGLLAALWTRNKMALILYTTAAGVWAWNLIFPDAGRMHHVLLMAPLWQVAAGIALAPLALPLRVIALLLILYAGWDAARCYQWYAPRVAATGGINHWSDMTSAATSWLAANPQLAPVTTSWGIARPLYVLSGGKVDPLELDADNDFATARTLIERDRQLWLVSSVMPRYMDQWQRVVALAATLDKHPTQVANFPSRDGNVHIAAYRFDLPDTQPTRWLPQQQTEFPLDSAWQTLRFQLNGIADRVSENITIYWLDAQGQTLWTDARPFEWTPHIHQTSTFEFGPNLWPKNFIRIRRLSGIATRVRFESTLRSAKINHIEIGLP